MKGHTGWGGVGMQAYFQPVYYVFRVKDGVIAEAMTGEFGKNWRKGLSELKQLIEKWEKQY